MKDVAVSIIIPIYNAEKYLKQCVESVLNQTLKNIEIILINDGSTDESAIICEEFKASDLRIKYAYKKNEGLAAARQDGLELASGEYIGFVDSDDWVDSDMYEKMYKASQINNADVVLCNAYENNEKKRRMPIRDGAYNSLQIKEEILPKTLIGISEKGERSNIRWSNCLRLYKKETLDKYNVSFDRRFRRCQDLPFTFGAMLHASNFYYLDEFLYHNRQEAGSLSRGYTRDMWLLIKPLIGHIYEESSKRGDFDFTKLACSTAFFLALDCILNEFKVDAPSMPLKITHINSIVNDPVCSDALGKFDFKKLNSYYYKIFYKNMKEKKVCKLVIDYYYYGSSLKRKVVAPVLHILTENPLYEKIKYYMRG